MDFAEGIPPVPDFPDLPLLECPPLLRPPPPRPPPPRMAVKYLATGLDVDVDVTSVLTGGADVVLP